MIQRNAYLTPLTSHGKVVGEIIGSLMNEMSRPFCLCMPLIFKFDVQESFLKFLYSNDDVNWKYFYIEHIRKLQFPNYCYSSLIHSHTELNKRVTPLCLCYSSLSHSRSHRTELKAMTVTQNKIHILMCRWHQRFRDSAKSYPSRTVAFRWTWHTSPESSPPRLAKGWQWPRLAGMLSI